MLDTVINGTRTSRSILGNLSIPDDPAEAIALLKSSGWPIDLGPLNDAGLSQRGTDLNKANLLTDATERAIFGSTADRTVDNALERLRAQIVSAQNTANGKGKVYFGSYVGTGNSGPDYPNSIVLPFTPAIVLMMGYIDTAGNSEPLWSHTAAAVLVNDTRLTPSTYWYKFGFGSISTNSRPYGKISGQSIYWYSIRDNNSPASPNDQFNNSGYTYYYVVLG